MLNISVHKLCQLVSTVQRFAIKYKRQIIDWEGCAFDAIRFYSVRRTTRLQLSELDDLFDVATDEQSHRKSWIRKLGKEPFRCV